VPPSSMSPLIPWPTYVPSNRYFGMVFPSLDP
jgi:hypothetical protein